MDASLSSPRQTEAILHAQDYMQVLRSRWKTILLVFLLVFVSSAVITKMMTPKYMSGMTFERAAGISSRSIPRPTIPTSRSGTKR